jgi:hypothetical protein
MDLSIHRLTFPHLLYVPLQDLGLADQAIRGSISVLQEALALAPTDPKV